ncbi:MAG: retropepsin-like domain-containing protein [Fimbriimonadaceae bacterium]|nr:aspartyl protease family protein [Chthonomonadaceae bacterium]MCO5296053.1 retropepsin-like domain-containing protein [Fimbriimonadaceae bacterium]
MPFLAAFAAAVALQSGSAQVPLDVVLSNVRHALEIEKFEALPRGFQSTGKATYFGEESSYSGIFTPSGDFVETVAGNLGNAHGFDGKVAWEADWTGATRSLALRDRELLFSSVAIQTGRWLGKESPFDISLPKEPDGDATVELELRFRGGIHKTRITVDRATWLPVSESYESNAGESVTTFSDWRPTIAGKVPFRIENSEGGLTNVIRIERVEPTPTFVRNPFASLGWKALDTTFDTAVPAAVEVKRAFTGHILVHPLLDGKDVGWFILDSGAGSMVVDPKVADEVGMPKVGKVPVVGIGGVLMGSFRQSKTFALGPATIRDLKFIEIDLAQLSGIFRTKIAGIAGYDVFRRAIVELGLKDNRLELHDPVSFRLAKGAWQPLILDGKHPIVQATYEGDRKGFFRLDTGASGTLTFGGDLASKLAEGRPTKPIMLGGVGGMMNAKVGTIEYFDLAGHRFEKPEVTFMTDKRNALANEFLDGNIGQDLLLPFTMVFDYGDQRIAFVQESDAPLPARSGRWPVPLP